MTDDVQVSWLTVAGLLLITLATLMDEILLTRIFSVTTWYHFAFGAISLAMFGMTVGAYGCTSTRKSFPLREQNGRWSKPEKNCPKRIPRMQL